MLFVLLALLLRDLKCSSNYLIYGCWEKSGAAASLAWEGDFELHLLLDDCYWYFVLSEWTPLLM